MPRALIAGDNMAVSRAIETSLSGMGFDCFDHSWTEAQAVAVAGSKNFDLIVIGDALSWGSPTAVARYFCESIGTPVVMLHAGTCEVRRPSADGPIFDGPFDLSDLGRAVRVARRSRSLCGVSARPPGLRGGFAEKCAA
ncbi:hypothetical protein KRR38_30700 [Novosphingobium sp. G106]|uniref:hypothetical protein n=1 Tax=Novosphingobium sp. G106 TaxID=2849500 RepID=UPI001C2D0A84|nr:hypothetical protein [Novosphingobium sp. G106]MBV1691918.1 hypothetical protein [Novosphingobium sp. G106]